MKCLFCLNFLEQSSAINVNDILDVNSDITAGDLIRLHFSFAPKILQNNANNGICHNCWMNIDSFHEFYTLVENNYADNFDKENCIEEDVLKTEDDLIIYEISEKEEKEFIQDEIIKEEQQCSQNDETVTEWLTEEIQSYIPKRKIEIQSFSSDINDTADDQRIRETANMFCDICSEPLESLRDAKAHYKHIHQAEGYLMCCNRKFRQRCRLVEHVNTHYNYSYPCPICSKTFDSKSYLSKHLACHEILKEYVSFHFIY